MVLDSDAALLWATAAFARFRTPARVAAEAKAGTPVEAILRDMEPSLASEVVKDAKMLHGTGVRALPITDPRYPERLSSVPSAPPILFYRGNVSLLDRPAVGMCGSRDASEEGLTAARICGEQVARNGLTVVSGYARGVDMATHVGALAAGGSTIIVLAEGVAHFRVKQELDGFQAHPDNILVLSQFGPRQTWNAGAAMTRNGVIVGLSRALVVIEARERGGTLDAGMQALRLRRPLIALDFSTGVPKGNELLFARGAHRVSTPGELKRILAGVGEPTFATQISWLG